MSPVGERLSLSEDDTRKAGRELAATLSRGDIVALSGSLGAGKTVFVRGLAEGLGLDPRQVHSPTFAMVTEYGAASQAAGAAVPRLVHVDLYRIDRSAEIEDLGLDSLLTGDAVMAVEWAEKLPARLLAGSIHVTLEDLGGEQRRLTIERTRAAAPHSSPSQ